MSTPLNPHIRATVANRIVTIENDSLTGEAPIIVCGNADYDVEFTFDAEWDDIGIKTARFVVVRGKETSHTDVVFTGTRAPVPVMSNVELVYVGVFAGDIKATCKAAIRCTKSILCELPMPEPPSPDIYAQIMELFKDVKGASVWVRFSEYPDGTNFTEEWHEGQVFLGVATSVLTPTTKEEFTWTRLTQGPKGDKGDKGDTSLIGSIETVDGRQLDFFIGTQAEYDALPDEIKENNLFALITNDDSAENLDKTLTGIYDILDGIKQGTVVVGKAKMLNDILPISRGGTGATTAEEALKKMGVDEYIGRSQKPWDLNENVGDIVVHPFTVHFGKSSLSESIFYPLSSASKPDGSSHTIYSTIMAKIPMINSGDVQLSFNCQLYDGSGFSDPESYMFLAVYQNNEIILDIKEFFVSGISALKGTFNKPFIVNANVKKGDVLSVVVGYKGPNGGTDPITSSAYMSDVCLYANIDTPYKYVNLPNSANYDLDLS